MIQKILFLLLCLNISASAQFSLYLDNKIPVHTENITCISISKGGRFLAYGDKSGAVYLWDISAKRLLHQLDKHKNEVSSLIFDSSNQYLISGSNDKKIIIWDLYSGIIKKIIEDFNGKINYLVLSPDDRILAACGKKKEICLWEFPWGQKRGELKGHKKDVIFISYNLNGDQLLSVGKDEQMIVWDVGQLKLIRKTELESKTLKNSGVDAMSARESFDKYFIGIGLQERVLAKGGARMIFKYNIAFYEWNTGSEIELLEGNKKDIDFLAITPDKNYLVTDNSTLRQNKISFWNIQKGIIEQNYPIDGKISAIEVSENGKWLAVAYTANKELFKSFVNIWRLSGIEGFERFSSSSSIKQSASSGFGSAIKLTTPKEPLIQFGEKKSLAVLYFDSPGLTEDIAKTTSYLLEGKLGNSPSIELIERNQIEKVMGELKYQMSGFTASDAVEIGRHLNAKYVLIGSINKLGNLLIITTKLVNVETAQIEGTREVQCKNATIENIADMITVLTPTIARF